LGGYSIDFKLLLDSGTARISVGLEEKRERVLSKFQTKRGILHIAPDDVKVPYRSSGSISISIFHSKRELQTAITIQRTKGV
jgi:hypothetical protein